MKTYRLMVVGVVSLSAFLEGCATRAPAMYQWQGYQANVDAYLRADTKSLDEQIQRMEEDLTKIGADGGAVPPGYRAHLGLLYGQQGNLDRFAQNVQAEKTQYPESSTFMDFLMRNFRK